MIELMSALNGNIEKVLNFKRTGEYAVGDPITLADMEIFKYSQFAKDPLFNKYGDMQGNIINMHDRTPSMGHVHINYYVAKLHLKNHPQQWSR